MKKEYIVLGGLAGVAIVGGLVYAIVNTAGQQRDTQRQLDEIKKQMAMHEPTSAPAATAPEVRPSIIVGSTTQNGPVLSHEKAIHDVLTEGFHLLDARDPKKAETAAQIFREGIEKVDGKNVDFYRGLGRALIISHHYQDAVAAFVEGRKIDPSNAELSSGMGWAYWNGKDYYHAKQAWEEAIKINPKSIDAWMAMSWVYLGLKDRDKAITGFRVLLDSGTSDRIDWKNGLAMARASNFDITQIRSQFPLPDPELFSAPATTNSSATSPATH